MTRPLALPIQSNPLRTKEDLRLAFRQLTDPLLPYYSPGRALLQLGATGAGYSEAVAGMEGFSRVLWGLIPLLAGGGDGGPLLDVCLEGIRNGTDPAHGEYWGCAGDYDQRLVEMAAFGLALALVPEKLIEGLGRSGVEQLAEWLRPINGSKLWDCNWVLFRVMVQMGFRKAGLDYDRELTLQTLDEIERFYLGGGWYADGVGGHSDYYVPFAIQYYTLLYAVFMEDDDPERAKLYRERAAVFAEDFIHWFAEDGAALPYGRSLSYRFSQAAFWSVMAFAQVETPYPLGVIKGIILRHLRWWMAQPIFSSDGLLTIGYAYPNLVMAEGYNSPGSPYWAMKTFLILALPDSHTFWSAEELPLPGLQPRAMQKAPHLVLCRQQDPGVSHVAAFNSGHPASNEHTHTSAKYEKFVYSTFFGFSVPRAEWGLAQGAFDSMLALSEGDNLYRVKRRCEETEVCEDFLYAKWKPWADVVVQTWIIPGVPWHVRVHHIATGRVLDTAEGGFALGIEGTGSGGTVPKTADQGEAWAASEQRGVSEQQVISAQQGTIAAGKTAGGETTGIVSSTEPDLTCAASPAAPLRTGLGGIQASNQERDADNGTPAWAWAGYGRGASGIRQLLGTGRTELVFPQANTNVLVNRTVIPTIRCRVEAGTQAWLVSAVYGESFADAYSTGRWEQAPRADVVDGELQIFMGDSRLSPATAVSGEPVFRIRLDA